MKKANTFYRATFKATTTSGYTVTLYRDYLEMVSITKMTAQAMVTLNNRLVEKYELTFLGLKELSFDDYEPINL